VPENELFSEGCSECAVDHAPTAARSQFQREVQPLAHAKRGRPTAWLAQAPIRRQCQRCGASVHRSRKERACRALLQFFWGRLLRRERALNAHCPAQNDMAFSAGVPGWDNLHPSTENQNDGKIHPWPAFPTTPCGANSKLLARLWPNIAACLSSNNISS
jgi:hypothetical protein